MLPIPYFHVIVTVPSELRALCRSNQRDLYGFLMKATGQAITELAAKPRFCGGRVGILQVLHTWTGSLEHHPHAHCLVTGGGVSADGKQWCPTRRSHFIPERRLSPLVRKKFRALAEKRRPDLEIPKRVWRKKWVTKCVAWGDGETAVLEYLARYVFRIALTNARIVAMDDDTVTFRYKDRDRATWRTCRLTGEEFMRRFLQHVLPKGFHKVRYVGLWHHAQGDTVRRIRVLLAMEAPVSLGGAEAEPAASDAGGENAEPELRPLRPVHDGASCPHCGVGHLVLIEIIEGNAAHERSAAIAT